MGYHSKNKAEIVRKLGDDRKIVARVYCDEGRCWTEQEFHDDQLDMALAWVRGQMNERSM